MQSRSSQQRTKLRAESMFSDSVNDGTPKTGQSASVCLRSPEPPMTRLKTNITEEGRENDATGRHEHAGMHTQCNHPPPSVKCQCHFARRTCQSRHTSPSIERCTTMAFGRKFKKWMSIWGTSCLAPWMSTRNRAVRQSLQTRRTGPKWDMERRSGHGSRMPYFDLTAGKVWRPLQG